MFSESDLLMLSAIQHLAFCERQCCLIHIEQAWAENRLTTEGRILHERVHGQETESRGDVCIVRGLKLRSLELGLSGVADVVEFHRSGNGVALPGKKGVWRCFPVEYKRGKPKSDRCDEMQICAQAMCLEEMLNTKIENGALFYGAQHKRHEVRFDETLRSETLAMSQRLHELISKGVTPPAVYEKKCDRCSLVDICVPKAGKEKSVEKYLEEMIL
ncbi:MAG TPA: CRISPR-associated protein Cas4 [Chitinivibrionales bacterium]|nr:CRISPR-associated protein Cas4 [Chitinivibrionales bacterium]